jgi:hypothetical protein
MRFTRLLTAAAVLALVACTKDMTRGAPPVLEGGGGGPTTPEGSPPGFSNPVFVTPVTTPVPASNAAPSVGPVPVVIVSPAVGPIPSPSPIGTIAPIFSSPSP